jgi:hypothetical protein
MKASEMVDRAKPGPGWTTDKIIRLAKALLEEQGDLTSMDFYTLPMLGVQEGQSEEVSALLEALRDAHWKAKGKEPPELEPLE